MHLWLVIKIIFQRLSRITLESFSLLYLNCQIDDLVENLCKWITTDENENIIHEQHVINSRQNG
jgi:hypothetical protein